LDPITRAAERSVGRAVGFGALAIGCVVVGLAGYPLTALRAGATLTLLMAAVLLLKALAAPTRPYRRTELWLLLEPPEQPPAELAQRLVGGTLRRVLERYARIAALTAFAFWLTSLAWLVVVGR
jgi:hypothetical protein